MDHPGKDVVSGLTTGHNEVLRGHFSPEGSGETSSPRTQFPLVLPPGRLTVHRTSVSGAERLPRGRGEREASPMRDRLGTQVDEGRT